MTRTPVWTALLPGGNVRRTRDFFAVTGAE
jgi:hypothetical protein